MYKRQALHGITADRGKKINVFFSPVSYTHLGVAFLLREFVDIAISGSMDALYHMLKLFVLLLLVMVLVDSISFVFTNRFICRGMRQYKHMLLKGLLQRSISSFQKGASAQCMSGRLYTSRCV